MPTTQLNLVLETGQSQQQQVQSEALAQAKFWDKQINQGKLSMVPRRVNVHTNIVVMGESGLGKTVRKCTCCKR